MTPIPIVCSAFSITETRYIVIDKDTGKVLDDANGYGFRTAEKAMRHYNGYQKDIDDMMARGL